MIELYYLLEPDKFIFSRNFNHLQHPPSYLHTQAQIRLKKGKKEKGEREGGEGVQEGGERYSGNFAS
jgi:hypothetical protein